MTRFCRIGFFIAALFALIMAILAHPPQIPGNLSDKLQHMLALATLGVLAAIGFRERRAVGLFAWLTLFGAVIELVQALPFIHRDADWRDLVADAIAACIALAMTRLTFVRIRSKR